LTTNIATMLFRLRGLRREAHQQAAEILPRPPTVVRVGPHYPKRTLENNSARAGFDERLHVRSRCVEIERAVLVHLRRDGGKNTGPIKFHVSSSVISDVVFSSRTPAGDKTHLACSALSALLRRYNDPIVKLDYPE